MEKNGKKIEECKKIGPHLNPRSSFCNEALNSLLDIYKYNRLLSVSVGLGDLINMIYKWK